MTEKQKDAYEVCREKIDEALRELINSHSEHCDHEVLPEFLTDWIIVLAAHADDGMEENGTTYRRLTRPDQPPHVTMGLLEYEVYNLKRWMMRQDGD